MKYPFFAVVISWTTPTGHKLASTFMVKGTESSNAEEKATYLFERHVNKIYGELTKEEWKSINPDVLSIEPIKTGFFSEKPIKN
jgi:hypothetical protein